MFGIANLSNTAHDLQAVAGLLSVKTALFVSKSISERDCPVWKVYTYVHLCLIRSAQQPVSNHGLRLLSSWGSRTLSSKWVRILNGGAKIYFYIFGIIINKGVINLKDD